MNEVTGINDVPVRILRTPEPSPTLRSRPDIGGPIPDYSSPGLGGLEPCREGQGLGVTISKVPIQEPQQLSADLRCAGPTRGPLSSDIVTPRKQNELTCSTGKPAYTSDRTGGLRFLEMTRLLVFLLFNRSHSELTQLTIKLTSHWRTIRSC